MAKQNGIYAWIAWSMFNLVHKGVHKHYAEQSHKKAKPGWGYGPGTRKPVPYQEPETAPAP